jgi:hypothetical protein
MSSTAMLVVFAPLAAAAAACLVLLAATLFERRVPSRRIDTVIRVSADVALAGIVLTVAMSWGYVAVSIGRCK